MALIDAPALAALLHDPNPPTVIDVRWRLGGPPGIEDYRAGHIPGAHFVDLDRDLCGTPGPAGRHPLPDPEALQQALRAAGVRTGHPVVAYDGGEGQAAARLWWTLRWAGHAEVVVLDGGFPAWVEAGLPVTAATADAPAGDVVVRPGGMPVLDATDAARLADAGRLLDARVAPRYRGEVEPVDPVAGHIPGARNVPVAELAGPDGRLRSAEALRAVFEDSGVRPEEEVGAYCGSGVVAARTVLALEVAGYAQPALYVGSWSNWVADPSRRVATGDEA